MEPKAFNSTTDEELVELYKGGDSQVLGLLYERYSKKVYGRCWTFAHNYDEAYDLSHEILLKAFEKIGSFKGSSTFSTWLYSVAFNHCVEYYRKNKKFKTVEFDGKKDFVDEYFDEEQAMEQEKMKSDVIGMLDDISETDKKILVMKYQEGYSLKDLQEIFKMGESAIKMRLLRAKEKVEKRYNLSREIVVAG